VNISDEAVEVLAHVLAHEALVEADMAGAGWDAEHDSPEPFMPRARERAQRYLEAAAPHMLSQEQYAKVEYGVFRKNGDAFDAPMGNRTFKRIGSAEPLMKEHRDWQDWLEVRSHYVSEWQVEN
jgi:hypothetical protein